ncbi:MULTISPECIES: helix-turn-helix transcriptional regulator [Bradyrhizobium]|uniref:LuxR C-terminal-related transcriptional regulator n=2 Tax=Bradyrhizobium quebecense TaxID=2748629 RepID=A0ACD3VGT8_9BRAD|nr:MULTISPECIES: helix-turn-helix domain-containing protein [Bradyrhizobium]UFX46477.1 LuxR C-terminal-related transcriptional regulator [Bradyrhizobium sp. 41S5]UGY05707.1 LuxR C-terminal-related transcriptional regulator [Bradyrhizobium quebecense]
MSNVASTSVPVKSRRRARVRNGAADMISSRSRDGSLARRASAFLLDLYAMSRTHSFDRFQQATLSRLRVELPFCSAYWGMLRAPSEGPLTLHSTFVDELPGEFVREWETVKHKDELAARVIARPGVASSIRTVDMNHNEFMAMGERFGIGSATSIAVVAPVPRLLTFLSLYRPFDELPFDHDDRCLQEIIMPHVAAAWHANRMHHFEGVRAGTDGSRKGFAVADRYGVLHVSDAAFSALMRSEWPSWSGHELPAALRSSIAGGCDYEGDQLTVLLRRQGDLILLQVRRRSALDRLSPREAEIVGWYREGLSYKQIAMRLGCSPYTIRHHLREIYGKLGVCNKIALIRLAGDARMQ